jgi:hypothetical protein
MQRILDHVGLTCDRVYGKSGKEQLLNLLPRYNQAARFMPWVVVVDLDRDAECAPDFVVEKLAEPTRWMCFRVAVRAIEAWLLADREHLANFLRVPVNKFPVQPDSEHDPKATLVNLARQSKLKTIHEDMVPRPGTGRSVGTGYAARLSEFIRESKQPWRPDIARQHSDSLQRCLDALASLKDWTPTD